MRTMQQQQQQASSKEKAEDRKRRAVLYVEQHEPLLMPDQLLAYRTVCKRIESKKGGGIFNLVALGGGGKTFVINLLLSRVRSKGGTAIATASSGIAATLLQEGRTAHSAFRLPRNLDRRGGVECGICCEEETEGTVAEHELARCDLIVWDECPMMHRHGFEALDRKLQSLRGNTEVMGDAVVVLSGDFRQLLPIVVGGRGQKEKALAACIKASYLWQHVEPLRLSTNMRVHLHQLLLQGGRAGAAAADSGDFANLLLQVGNGKGCDGVKRKRKRHVAGSSSSFVDDEGNVFFGRDGRLGHVVHTLEELEHEVYGNLEGHVGDDAWLGERVILAPKNRTVDCLNSRMLARLDGRTWTYVAKDARKMSPDAPFVPILYAGEETDSDGADSEGVDPQGMPSRLLHLKVGAPVMILVNLDLPRLCNGTRLCITRLLPNSVEGTIMSGSARGEQACIRLEHQFRCKERGGSIFVRSQLPLRLCYAMSIHKAQGQSLEIAGVHLLDSCFSHGQLYVALSRVGNPCNLFVLLASDSSSSSSSGRQPPLLQTRNIVYRQVL